MSLFGKDFLKDSLNDDTNDFENNQFFSHQDLNFGNDNTHQNGFTGLSGYGVHGVNQLSQQQQQQRQMPGTNVGGLPQSQLYRSTSGPGLANLAGQDNNPHLFGSANTGRPSNNFPQSQGIIGGNIGSNLSSLGNNPRAVGSVGEIGGGAANGRFLQQDINPIGRFGGGGGQSGLGGIGQGQQQFSGLGGNNQLRSGILDDDDNDDFPALPKLGGGSDVNSLSSQSNLQGGASQVNSMFSTPTTSSLQMPGTIGLGSSSLLNQQQQQQQQQQRSMNPTSNPLYPAPGNQFHSSGLLGGSGADGNMSSNSSLSGSTLVGGGGSSGIGSIGGPVGGGGGGVGVNQQQTSSLLSNLGLQPSASSAASSIINNSASAVGANTSNQQNKFGMSGLLEIIRSQEKDIHVLALGTDLTTFGLNLNAAESLYTSFTSPFSDTVQSDEPQYKTPSCYLMSHPPVLKADHWSKLTSETLFYIFYQMPKDILQACAAQELYRRDWRFHGELKIWLKPHHNRPGELMNASTPQFVYFDAKLWEQKFLNPQQIRGNILAGLIPEEEIRVKVPAPGQSNGVEATQI